MKPRNVLLFVCSAAMAAACAWAGDAATNKTYSVLRTQRIDGNRARRLQVWVAVPDGLSTGQVAAVASRIAAEHPLTDALSVVVMREGEEPGAYTVAMGEWAPGGDWSRANEGADDPKRLTYRMSLQFRDDYFATSAGPKGEP